MNAESKQPTPPDGLPRLNRPTCSVLVIVALLVPYILLLLRLDLSQLPDVDYWYMSLQIWNPDGTLNFPGLFEVWNQHFVVTSKSIFVLNTYLTGGSNYGLVTTAVSFSFFCSLILSVQFLRAMPAGFELVRIGAIFAVATGLTAVSGSHLFQMGMSGTQWYAVNLMALLALLAQNYGWTRQGRSCYPWVVLAALLGLLSCLSSGSGYAVLPALILLALIKRRPLGELLVFLPVFLLSFTLFLYAQARPLNIPGVEWSFGDHGEQWPAIAKMILIPPSLIGSLFTDDFMAAVSIGLPTCILFLVLFYFVIRKHQEVPRLTYYFFGVGLFGGGAVMATTLGRLDRPVDLVMAQSRYASFPALFLVGLLLCGSLLILQYRARLPFRGVAVVILALSVILAVGIQARKPLFWKIHTLQKERGSIYLRLGEVPEDLGIFPQKGQGFEHLYQALSHLNHYPFNNSHPLHARLGQALPDRRGVLPLLTLGIQPLSEQTSKVGGLARLPRGERLEYVYLTDQHGVVIGAAQPGFEMLLNKENFPADSVFFQGAIRSRSGEREKVLIYGTLEGQEGVFRIAETANPAPPVPREE